MSLGDYLTLVLLAWLVVAFLVARAAIRIGRRSAIRMGHHLERRAIDAILIAFGLHWLTRGHRAGRRPPVRQVLEGDEIYRACTLSAWQGDPAACRWCNRALPDRSKRFCRPECSTPAHANHVFGGPGGARATALVRDRYACRRCGASADNWHALEVHHAGERAMGRHGIPGCWHHLDGLISLCHRCHEIETAGQRQTDALNRPRRWVS